MQFFIEIMGDKLVAERLTLMGQKAVAARPAMEEIALMIFEIQKEIFERQGARGGPKWADITAEWWYRKYHSGLDTRILHATHALRDSMTNPEAPGNIATITNRSVSVGSDLPYAARHNRERPFARLLVRDRQAFKRIIARHLMSAMRAGPA